MRFRRDELPRLKTLLQAASRRRDEIKAKIEANKDPLNVNPLSGNCGYCPLLCPLRSAVTSGDLAVGPLQTPDEAKQLALGIQALLEAEGNGDLKPRARALHERLLFPADHDSSPGFRRIERNARGEIETPGDDALRKLFEELQR